MMDMAATTQPTLDVTFTALADPTRRAILARLAQGEATVSELARPFRISQPAISKHLKVLENAGLIETGQVGQTRPRRLNPAGLKAASAWFEAFRELWSDSFDRLEALLEDQPETAQPKNRKDDP